VLNALLRFYEHGNANPSKSPHAMARRAHEQYEAARASCYLYTTQADIDALI
jgi:selenocysteine lyase/cysteine desulfurase